MESNTQVAGIPLRTLLAGTVVLVVLWSVLSNFRAMDIALVISLGALVAASSRFYPLSLKVIPKA